MKWITTLLLFCGMATAQAQPWQGILDPTRAADWTYAGIPGGIPTDYTLCQTVQPTGVQPWMPSHQYTVGQAMATSSGGGFGGQPGGTRMVVQVAGTSAAETLDSSGNRVEPNWNNTIGATTQDGTVTWVATDRNTDVANIGAALAACGGKKGYVQLVSGTYYITAAINYGPSVVNQTLLKGEGPEKTSLIFQVSGGGVNGGAIILSPASASEQYYYGDTKWTAGYSRGGTVLTVDSVAGLNTDQFPSGGLGNIIHIDQRNDSIGICPPTVATSNAGYCTVPGATESGTTVTIAASLPHGFQVGDQVGIGLVYGGTNATGYNSGGTAPNWAADTQYPPNMLVAGGGNLMFSSSGGLSGSSTPSWPTANGGTVTDNTVQWTRMAAGTGYCSNVPTTSGMQTSDCPWWTITDVGCFLSGTTYTTASGCGSTPITAFRYTARLNGLQPGGGTTTGNNIGGATVNVPGIYAVTVRDVTHYTAAAPGRMCPAVNYAAAVMHCAPGERSSRAQMEVHRITAIDPVNHQITIWPPLIETNWRSSQDPRVWWVRKSVLNGIEDMTVDMSGLPRMTGGVGINLGNCYECWAKNVRTIRANRNHIGTFQSAQCDIRDNYFYDSRAGISQSYGVELGFEDTYDLLQNNMCERVVSCVMVGTTRGSVIAYNFAIDSGYNPPTWNQGLISFAHNSTAFPLLEGNAINLVGVDNFHASSYQHTAFRNRFHGYDFPPRQNTASMMNSELYAFARATNFIGNVMGWPTIQNQYEIQQRFQPAIYTVMGNSLGGPSANDAGVKPLLMRWGNYDTVTGTTRWCGTDAATSQFCSCGTPAATNCTAQNEVPTSPPQGGWRYINANPVPATRTLPASLYLSGPPRFWQTPWGTPGWPAIGPDVDATGSPLDATCTPPYDQNQQTGDPILCNGVAHHSYLIPAQLCMAHSPVDPNPLYTRSWAITNATFASGVITLNVPANTLSVGNAVTVAGMSVAAFNRSYVVVSATGSQITVAMPINPGASATGGTVTLHTPRLFNGRLCYPNDFSGTTPPPPPPLGQSTIKGQGTIRGQGVIKLSSGTVTPPPTLTITTTTCPFGTPQQPFTCNLQASGGTPPLTWSVTGTLPAGLGISGATITGTPTTAGTSNFTIQVTDSTSATASAPLSITVSASTPPPVASDVALPQTWVWSWEYVGKTSNTINFPASGTGGNWTCPGGASYGPYTANDRNSLQAAIDNAEQCRIHGTNHPGTMIVIPSGSRFSAGQGLILRQSVGDDVSFSNFIILTSSNPLPIGVTPCSHGVQDNLPQSTDIGLMNWNCDGTQLSYQINRTIHEIPQGAFTLANGKQVNTADYNDLSHMYRVECTNVNCQTMNGSIDSNNIGDHHYAVLNGEFQVMNTSGSGSNIINTATNAGRPTLISAIPQHIHFAYDWIHADWTNAPIVNDRVTDTGYGRQLNGNGIVIDCEYCSFSYLYFNRMQRPGYEGHDFNPVLARKIKIVHNWVEASQINLISWGPVNTVAVLRDNRDYIPFEDVEQRAMAVSYPYSWNLASNQNIRPNAVFPITGGNGTGAKIGNNLNNFGRIAGPLIVANGGSGYRVGDIVTLQANGYIGGAGGLAEVTAVDGNGSIVTLVFASGRGYHVQQNVPTTMGTGGAININSVNAGALTTAGMSIANAGSGYIRNSIIPLTGTNATINITSVGATGNITGLGISFAGTGIVPTQNVPLATGSGLTINITSVGSGGEITGVTVNNPGNGYCGGAWGAGNAVAVTQAGGTDGWVRIATVTGTTTGCPTNAETVNTVNRGPVSGSIFPTSGAAYAGTSGWGKKNLWEYKAAHRVLMDGMSYRNNDSSGGQNHSVYWTSSAGNGAGTNILNYQVQASDITYTNSIVSNGCAGTTMGSWSAIGTVGASMGSRRMIMKNVLQYGLGQSYPDCNGASPTYQIRVSAGSGGNFANTVVHENAAGTMATATLDGNVRGRTATTMSVGQPVMIRGCTGGDTAAFIMPGDVLPGSSPLAPLAAEGTETWGLNVVYPWTAPPNSSATGCQLMIWQGRPDHVTITHNSNFNLVAGSLPNAPFLNSHNVQMGTGGTVPYAFMSYWTYVNSISVNGLGIRNPSTTEGAIVQERTLDPRNQVVHNLVLTERDRLGQCPNHTTIPSTGRINTCYLAFDDQFNPINPPSSTIWGTSTGNCVGNDPTTEDCVGIVGLMSRTEATTPLDDWHGYRLCHGEPQCNGKTSKYAAGQQFEASDHTDMGVDVVAIDRAMTSLQYCATVNGAVVCGYPDYPNAPGTVMPTAAPKTMPMPVGKK